MIGVTTAWQLQAAKQHFSELVERARREGPQVVTKHGKEAVVVVSAEEYRRLRESEPSLVDFIRSAPDFALLDLERTRDPGRETELYLSVLTVGEIRQGIERLRDRDPDQADVFARPDRRSTA